MGCAPSSKVPGSMVVSQRSEENNNPRLTTESSNCNNEDRQNLKPDPTEQNSSKDNQESPIKDDPNIYGIALPDQTDEEIPENKVKRDNTYIPKIEQEKQVHMPSLTNANKSDNLTVELLNEFIDLDREIQESEGNRTEEKLTFHQMEYNNIGQALKQKQSELEEMKKNMDNEEENPLNCSSYMQSHQLCIMADGDAEDPHKEVSERKENLECLESMNKQEVCEKQVEELQTKINKINEAVDISLKEVDQLSCKRLKLNGLLENVFSGNYGSDLENRLELETEQLLQYKQHVSVSHYKWWNSRLLINRALTQMTVACKSWKEIKGALHNEEEKYKMATDTRNNIVAVHQNCVRTEEYLKIDLPYWTPQDNKNILDSINGLYSDLLSSTSHQKAYTWFYYYHQRLGMQLNWMDRVINNKIVGDYRRVSQEFKVKYRELRKERLRLIQEKAKEKLNIDWDIEPFLKAGENENDDDMDTLPMVESNTVHTDELTADDAADTVSLPPPVEDSVAVANDNSDNNAVTSDDEKSEGPPLARRLSLSELAPTPSDNDLFGNVEQLEIMHRRQMEEFDKAQELNKAQQEQGLKEKLRERQSKRRKQMLQHIQETALSADSPK